MESATTETSATDRLASLFGSGNVPKRLNTNEPTFAERELAVIAERESKWKIPETAQTPRKIHGLRPQPAAGGDLYTTSEDEDDYVAAFQKKPKMISPPSKKRPHKQSPRKMSQAGSFGYQNGQISKKSIIAHADPPGADNSAKDLPKFDDQGNPAMGHFCQLGLVTKFPYKYMMDENNRISSHFFANQKIYKRQWDLYYLHGPESSHGKPLLLLPYFQVKQLIDNISTVFKVEVYVPVFPFTLSFFDDGTPQPIYLGTTMSRAGINDCQAAIPAPAEGHGEPPVKSTEALDHSFAAFKAKFEPAQAAEKHKKTAMKRKKANDRLLNIQNWCKQLRRAQRYFGIRLEAKRMSPLSATATWEEQQAHNKEQELKSSITLLPLDITKPAPHDFHLSPVIVSIDIESYERQHDIITEVGISTLDTLDLVNIPPGENGENWMAQIRSRHFRIKGREHYINKDFCIGDGNAFQFGESEWVDLADIGNVIDSCFEWPFSVEYKHDGKLKLHREIEHSQNRSANDNKDKDSLTTHMNNSTKTPISTADRYDKLSAQKGPQTRNFLFTGHDIGGDLAYLSRLNSAIFSCPRDGETKYPPSPEQVDPPDLRAMKGAKILSHIVEAVDTATLYKVLHKEQNNRSLTSIMADIGRSAFYPHNGGNDARYTLEALIGLVIKSRLTDDEAEARHQKDTKEAITAGNVWNKSKTDTKDADGTSAWEAEKQKRINEKVGLATREVEEEMEARERAGVAGMRSSSQRSSPKTSPMLPQNGFDATHLIQSLPTNGNGDVPTNESITNSGPFIDPTADEAEFTHFASTLSKVHNSQDKKKKSAATKRRELEMRVRKEDGIRGARDWAVGGNGVVGK